MTPDPQPCSLQLPPGQTLARVTPLYMRKVTTVEHSPPPPQVSPHSPAAGGPHANQWQTPAPDPYPPFWPREPRSVSLTRAQAGDTYREAGRSFAPWSLHTGPAPRDLPLPPIHLRNSPDHPTDKQPPHYHCWPQNTLTASSDHASHLSYSSSSSSNTRKV